jgi:hypothetical protein
MLQLIGAPQVIDSLYTLAAPQLNAVESSHPTTADIKRALHRWLSDVQPETARPSSDAVAYIGGGPDHARLLKLFNATSKLDDTDYRVDAPTNAPENERKLERIRAGVERLQGRDEVWGQVFDLSMFSVFAAPCEIAGGGTASHAVGVLWVDPRERWTDRDIEELLIHELAHTLLFYEEWRYGLFTSAEAMLAREHYALSAIRAVERPLDKSLHSVVVATEVLLARDSVLGHPAADGLHPRTEELAAGTLASIDSIFENADSVLTPRSRELMGACRERVTRLTTGVPA